MNALPLIGHWFWLFALGLLSINYVKAARRLNSTGTGNETDLASARRALRWFAVGYALPWLVMGWGIAVGGVPGLWNYFRPQDGNVWVSAWLASVFVSNLAFTAWVFLGDGARLVHAYELLSLVGVRRRHPSVSGIKAVAAFLPFFCVAWIALASQMNVPVPH